MQLSFFMTDLKTRGYLERHAPANLEFNQFPLTVRISVAGAGTTPRLFTNGKAETSGNVWEVTFPAHFSSSSFFLHLSDRPFHVQNDSFNGKSATIPLLAYGLNQDALPHAIATAKSVLAELESTYGAYAHDRLTMYIAGPGGMEYCGATMTSLGALPHEILHSWFARGVMPANGSAGWIDEGIAKWRDNQYPTRQPDPEREPTQLSGFSPYQRHTPRNAYDDGSLLFSELDHLFGQGAGKGLRPVLGRALSAEEAPADHHRFPEELSGKPDGPQPRPCLRPVRLRARSCAGVPNIRRPCRTARASSHGPSAARSSRTAATARIYIRGTQRLALTPLPDAPG